MNAFQSGKIHNIDKQFPRCLGITLNLFDVSAGLAAGNNQLLTDKPHHDGSAFSRSRSDVGVTVDPLNGNRVEDRKIMSKLQKSPSNKKSSSTPMKMLIAQEMSKEVECKQSPPNLVAKLMGLDSLPMQLPNSVNQRGLSKGCKKHNRSKSLSGIQVEYPQHGRSYSEVQVHRGYHDNYDVWQQSQKGKPTESTLNEKKMALVRQKFMEAKRLAPDESRWQSKEFQDAVDVLSSNSDIFLKFLQEPNSLVSRHLHELQSIPSPPPETKRITILRPSKMVENTTKRSSSDSQDTGWNQGLGGYPPADVDDYDIQPTRIVVLKPGHGKHLEVKSSTVPPSTSPRVLHADDLSQEEDGEAQESKEMAKEITHMKCGNLSGHRRDETLLSSVFSNGYIGDDSSFNKSDTEYADGNLSDSEALSPTSRHSWEFLNRAGSSYSMSSYSRASYSPESSVCREAKRRLSERWSLMASNQTSVEQRHVRKSSSTLGEMLALSDGNKEPTHEVNGNNKDKGTLLLGLDTSLHVSINKEETLSDSPKDLSRSKSLPAASTVYNNRLNVELAGSGDDKSQLSEEQTKKTSGKSSLKWRLSSLFFSRSKKSRKEESGASQSKDESQPKGAGTPESMVYSHKKVGSSVSDHAVHGHLNENHDHPSPISVLDQSFEQDDKALPEAPGKHISSQLLGSNLIDKSPRIESVARTLSWNDDCFGSPSSYLQRPPKARLVTEEEKQHWLEFIQTVLSTAGLDCPLDPSLRDKLSCQYDKELLPEAKKRQRRSNRKLVFDSVNATLIEITGNNAADGARSGTQEGTSGISAGLVWARMKGWFCDEGSCVCGEDDGDRTNLVTERVVRNEVVGKGWIEGLRLEIDNLDLEIERKLLEELLDVAVVDFAEFSNASETNNPLMEV